MRSPAGSVGCSRWPTAGPPSWASRTPRRTSPRRCWPPDHRGCRRRTAAHPLGSDQATTPPLPARVSRRSVVTTRVGVNGFGRIGRNFWRAADALGHDIEIVAANDLGDLKTMAHLLQYDTVFGRLPHEVEVTGDGIAVHGRTLKILSERDPAALPWGDLGVDVVVE